MQVAARRKEVVKFVLAPIVVVTKNGQCLVGATMTMQLKELRSLGQKSQQMLHDAGIFDLKQLEALGAVAAYRQVKAVCPRASLNLLWALESALTGVPWQDVARWQRQRLLAELAAIEVG